MKKKKKVTVVYALGILANEIKSISGHIKITTKNKAKIQLPAVQITATSLKQLKKELDKNWKSTFKVAEAALGKWGK